LRPRRSFFALALLAVLLGLVPSAAAGQTKTVLVSKTGQGDPAEAGSFSDSATLSDGGRLVAFYSDADNLPGNDSYYDVYVHDRQAGSTRLVSQTSSGDPADGHSQQSSISGNGRFVVFYSDADNLPGEGPIYVRDLETQRTRVVVDTPSPTANTFLTGQAISSDGRFIVFSSADPSLPGPSTHQVYRYDRRADATRLVSRNSQDDPADEGSSSGAISDGGRYVAFTSSATNLPQGDGSTERVYVRDLTAGTTRLVSKTSGGDPLPYRAASPTISGSGRVVAFEAILQSSKDCIESRIYVHDRKTGTTQIGSRNTSDEIAEECSHRPLLSDDGRLLSFDSTAENLPGASVPGFRGFVRNLQAGSTSLVTRTTAGMPVSGQGLALSGSGEFVGFGSGDDALPGPVAGAFIYVRGPL
jgi:hypothetical protein